MDCATTFDPATRSARLFLVLLSSVLLWPGISVGQKSASASVAITATVHGSLSINVRTVPLTLDLASAAGARNYFAVPVVVQWNLNPAEVHAFEVVAYFADPGAALRDAATGVAIPSAYVLGRIGQGGYRPFAESNYAGPAGGSLSLFRTAIVPGASRGQRQDLLEIKVDEALLPGLPENSYRGTLYLEARHY